MLTRLSLAVVASYCVCCVFFPCDDYRLPHAVLFLFVLRHITNVSCCFSSGNHDERHWEKNGKLVVPKMLVPLLYFFQRTRWLMFVIKARVAVWSLAFIFLRRACGDALVVFPVTRRRDFLILFVEWSSDRLHWIHPAAVASLLIIKSAFNRSQ